MSTRRPLALAILALTLSTAVLCPGVQARPAADTVESTMAFGSGRPASAASASHEENWSTGSAASMDSSRPRSLPGDVPVWGGC